MRHCLSTISYYQKQKQTEVGYIYSILGSVFMSVMQVCAKQLALYFMTSETLLYRSFCLALINSAYIYLQDHPVYIKKPRVWKVLCVRMVVSALCVYLQFLPLKYLPIGIVNSIRTTAPVFTHFLESCIIGTRVNKRDLLITMVSFFGIILLVKPSFIFGETENLNMPLIYIVFTFIGTILLSLQLILVRLVKDDVTNDIILQYFYLSQIFINALLFLEFQVASEEPLLPLVPSCIGLFVLLILAGYCGQLLNVRALFLITASQSMPFRYVGVIIGFTIDVLYYGVSLDWIMILGLVITSGALIVLSLSKGAGKGKVGEKGKEDLKQ